MANTLDRVTRALSWLTVLGLVLMISGYNARMWDVPYPLPITLLCCGAFLFVIAGIPWAHTRGQPKWKAAFLGVVGFACGGAIGFFLGEALDPGGESDLGIAILLLIGGFSFGAILFGSLGIWWGVRFHRRYASQGKSAEA